MIDPNFWESGDISRLSVFERLLFIGMISNADDEGKGRASPSYLKSKVFPYDEKIKVADIKKALTNIENNTSVVFYEQGENGYYFFSNWAKWQRVDKPQKSLIPNPTPEQLRNNSKNDSGIIPDQLPPKGKEGKEKGKEGEGEGKEKGKEPPPQPPLPVLEFTVTEGLLLYEKLCPTLFKKETDSGADTALKNSRELMSAISAGFNREQAEKLFIAAESAEWLKSGAEGITLAWIIENRAEVLAGKYNKIFGKKEELREQNGGIQLNPEKLGRYQI
jgi:hypothetical protein